MQGRRKRSVDVLESFISYLSIERGLSRNTVDSYVLDLKGFFTFLGRAGQGAAGIYTGKDIVDYLGRLKDGG